MCLPWGSNRQYTMQEAMQQDYPMQLCFAGKFSVNVISGRTYAAGEAEPIWSRAKATTGLFSCNLTSELLKQISSQQQPGDTCLSTLA